MCAFGSVLLAACLGRTVGACCLKSLPKCIKKLPVAEEGTKPGVAELQAFADEESMNFFVALLCVSWDAVRDTNARKH